jgi:hypothetical protein
VDWGDTGIITVLAVVFAVAVGAAWIRERRQWRHLYEVPPERSGQASLLYNILLRDGIRAKYKFSSAAPMMGAGRTETGERAIVLVHRDDLEQAQEISAELREAGRIG